MIIDVTGTELTPGNFGRDCLGNGEHEGVECCCDECDYYSSGALKTLVRQKDGRAQRLRTGGCAAASQAGAGVFRGNHLLLCVLQGLRRAKLPEPQKKEAPKRGFFHKII